jgi:hypothetical protein
MERNNMGIDIDPEYYRMPGGYLRKKSSNLFINTELIFEKMITDLSGQVQVCKDQALYKAGSVRKTIL